MRHLPGYSEARANVEAMDLPGLLSLIDDLFGRKNLKYGATEADVREEALHQLSLEWTDRSPEAQRINERVEFHVAAAKAQREMMR